MARYLYCAQCQGPMGDSPSDYWCSQLCQARYQAAQVGATLTDTQVYAIMWGVHPWFFGELH